MSSNAARLAFQQRRDKALMMKRVESAKKVAPGATADLLGLGAPSTMQRREAPPPYLKATSGAASKMAIQQPPAYSPESPETPSPAAAHAAQAVGEANAGGHQGGGTPLMSQSRRNSLLKQAREERDAFLDGGQESEPPESMLHEPQSVDHVSHGSLDNQRDRSKSNDSQEKRVSNIVENTPVNDDDRASFLQTAQRLFSFLNRFSSDGNHDDGDFRLPDFHAPSGTVNESKGDIVSRGAAISDGKNCSNSKASRQAPRKNQFNYKAFKEKIKNPHAGEAFKTIKHFVVEFSRSARERPERLSRREAGERTRQFIDEVRRLMSANELWCHDDPHEWDNTCEGLEKFVTSKLYEHLFCPREEDRIRDQKLHDRISSLSFVKFEHLDIVGAETNDDFRLSWQLAMDELRKMNDYKAPRDKMVCLLNACKVIVQLLSDAREDADESPPGADEFLPALIYVVLKSNPPNLFSNLDYIDCFRDPKKLISEPGYWYTNLYSAVTFLENVEHDRLSISEEEFAAGITKAKSQMEQAKQMAISISSRDEGGAAEPAVGKESLEVQKLHSDSTLSNSSPEVVEKARQWTHIPPLIPKLHLAGKPAHGNDQSVLAWKAQRFRFLPRKFNELRMVEVESLLREYKHLASSCDQLLDERKSLLARIYELENK
eukprot:g330.t1